MTSYKTNALNTHKFYAVLGEIKWMRLEMLVQVKHADILNRDARINPIALSSEYNRVKSAWVILS